MSTKLTQSHVYGTLADWETGIYTALQPLLSRFPETTGNWTRKEALQAFTAVEGDLQAQYPEMRYSKLLAKVHEVLQARFMATSAEEKGKSATAVSELGEDGTASTSANPSPAAASEDAHTVFGHSIKDWSVFPDSPGALQRLANYFKLTVLSNADHSSFGYTHLYLSDPSAAPESHLDLYSYPSASDSDSGTSTSADATEGTMQNVGRYWHPRVAAPKSKSPFTLVLTAQDTGMYKPALEGFYTALECIRNDPALLGTNGSEGQNLSMEEAMEQVLVVAQSLIHDHEPARRLGIRSVWIDREGAELSGGDGTKKWTWRFRTLGEMADAVEHEASD